MNLKCFAVILCLCCLAERATADGQCIFYVDAGLANTTIGGNTPEEGINYTTFDTIGNGSDGLWHYPIEACDN